ncbi:energy-coupling factor transporter ATPase [candidate division KSB1 bacterium]|nr:energy-coupling factor transporter ATPase [candidate division KSB1 bacterium]
MKIKIENLSFSYTLLSDAKQTALDNVSLEIGDNELIGIMGHSGSGKTTLIQHFTGLLKPTSGKVLVNGKDIWEDKAYSNEIRRKIGIVFQFPESQLFEETVYADIAFGPLNLNLAKDEIDARVRHALEIVGLDFDQYSGRNPHHLSEGEKRRVALAGVFAMQPEVLVLDEPTAGLDPAGIKMVNQIVKSLQALGKSVIIVSHNLAELIKVVDRIVLLSRGRVMFDGHKNDLIFGQHVLAQSKIDRPRVLRLLDALKRSIEQSGEKEWEHEEFEALFERLTT